MRNMLMRCITVLLVFFCTAPFLYVLAGGFMNEGQFSLQAYYDVFLASPRYLHRFWKSLGIGACITLGQLLVSTFAGFGFAKYQFPGKKILYFCILILMILPVQVTLVPNYIMLTKMNLMGSVKSLIYPSMFLPLGTVIMTQSFMSISDSVIDQSRLDGCNVLMTIVKIAVPMNKSSLVCVGLLSFLDAWNMVEQPVAYLKDFSSYPLSVALAYVSPEEPARQFACCLMVLLPPLALFSWFSRELGDGILLEGDK